MHAIYCDQIPIERGSLVINCLKKTIGGQRERASRPDLRPMDIIDRR